MGFRPNRRADSRKAPQSVAPIRFAIFAEFNFGAKTVDIVHSGSKLVVSTAFRAYVDNASFLFAAAILSVAAEAFLDGYRRGDPGCLVHRDPLAACQHPCRKRVRHSSPE